MTGQASVYGELYDAFGIDRRRPPSTGRLSFTPTLAFSNLFSASADLMLSTEGSYARQNMNIMGLHPAWKWGRAHLGDYSEDFSSFTFNGVNVTGAEVDLFPKKYRFTLGGGRTRRAVEGDATSQAFAQYLLASRAGYGDPQGTFLHLIFLKVADDPQSLVPADTQGYTYVIPDTLDAELDTLWVIPPYNPYAVTPQENLVVGLSGKVQLLEKRLVVGMELAGAGFTKDLEAGRVAADSLSGPLERAVNSVFAWRTSSCFDYALKTEASLNFWGVRSGLVFRQAGPGYMSLGLPSSPNDRRELDVTSSFKLGNSHLSLGHSFMTDNLAGQKLETNLRNQSRVTVATAFKRWRSTVNANILLMGNNAEPESLEYDYHNLNLSTHQAVVFGQDRIIRQTGIQYSYQTSLKNMAANAERSNYHTVNLTADFRLPRTLTLSTSVGLSHRNSEGQAAYLTQVYSVRLSHAALKNRLTSSLSTSSSMVRDTRMYRTMVTSSYRLTKRNAAVFNFMHNYFKGNDTYNELRSSLTVTHSL